MATQDELLDAIWSEIINGGMDGKWIARLLADAKRHPNAPFADDGPIVQGMLDKGVAQEDICRLMRSARYEACFDLLYQLEQDPLRPEEFEGIHESLLAADPSGLEGRPGSWPIHKESVPRKKKPTSGNAPLLTVKRSFSFAFSSTGGQVSASADGRIWDIDSSKEVSKCKLYPNTTRMAFSPDSKRLAAVNTSGIVALFDAGTGDRLFTCKTGKEGNGVSFSPDGRFVLADNWEGELFVWQADDGKEFLKKEFGDVTIASTDFIKNGECVLTLRPPGMPTQYCLSVWDATFSAERNQVQMKQPCDKMWLEPLEGKHAVLSAKDQVWLCKLPSEQRVSELPGVSPRDAAFSPDGKWVAFVSDGEFVVADVPALQVVARRKCKYANNVAYSRDGSLIGLASWNKGEIWRLTDFLQANQA